MLSNIRIVLVEPSHPGNIGAAARAMKTMGLSRLCLVSPKIFPSEESIARASGAVDVLENALVTDNLLDAIGDCRFVVGTSSRTRTLSWPLQDAREAASDIIEAAQASEVAILFGSERTGLLNEHLEHCHAYVCIPTAEEYASLNLASAVQIMAYELKLAVGEAQVENVLTEPKANVKDMALFYEHLEMVMLDSGFLDRGQPNKLLSRLKCLFNRAHPEEREINILRGILTAVQKKNLE